jgi:multiple sugar transport system permease protein
MRVFRESYLMFGSYPDKALYFIQHYMNNHFAKLNYQTLSAASLLFFLPVLLVFGLMLHLERKATEQIW